MRSLLLAVCCCAAPVFAGAPWSLADVEAAATAGSWAELLERAEDVPPSARTDRWRTLVSDAAATALEKTAATPDKPFAVAERARTLAARYAFLEKAPRFSTARSKASLAALEACVKADRDDCLDVLQADLETLSGDGALAAARWVRKGYSPASAMPLVARAVSAQASACADALTSEVVLAALELPDEDTRAPAARKVAFETCWSALSATLKKTQIGASKYRLVNSCKAMRSKRALTELQDDLCKDEEQ